LTKKSFFIAIEGLDGSGTTTHSRILAASLENMGYKVFLTQEPSSSEIGNLLRKFLKNKSIPPSVDALLFAADRAYHFLKEIKKKLEKGYIVISDRYLESSIVYQSAQSEKISPNWIKEINKFVALPDLTIILDINPRIALARKGDGDLEKFEESPFLNRVRKLYLSRAQQEGYFIVNSEDIIEFVQEKIQKIVINKLER